MNYVVGNMKRHLLQEGGIFRMDGSSPVEKGWMICDGEIINKENYEKLHGKDSYLADGIQDSPLVGKHLPKVVDFEFQPLPFCRMVTVIKVM